mmetsp:Transcript_21038/g.41267  ORF Transcript_21038/g.41267 Transcript_21038/m.41267 type:complete len:212 (-) Transcript_21038:813-1448(-)|eukprot:CAMPEP_0171501270 /NCGR_PEP_ID=MMETSP0958-20121227/9462_1 /TAXON_ID=87120 /ORGANISM="Aurantiochytrium limacinum, Strain ATCCMYA-1381" /LENGTH=211 /DNA_ID=CAMNT_0012036061 /DNA_START=353 /DNA_END=988 /DNA_ORIENTATION=+
MDALISDLVDESAIDEARQSIKNLVKADAHERAQHCKNLFPAALIKDGGEMIVPCLAVAAAELLSGQSPSKAALSRELEKYLKTVIRKATSSRKRKAREKKRKQRAEKKVRTDMPSGPMDMQMPPHHQMHPQHQVPPHQHMMPAGAPPPHPPGMDAHGHRGVKVGRKGETLKSLADAAAVTLAEARRGHPYGDDGHGMAMQHGQHGHHGHH